MDELAPGDLPLEALAYTPDEFEWMIERLHPTDLSALEDGRVLYDDGRARSLYRLVRKRTGLRRIGPGWVAGKLLPPSL